MLDSVNMKSTVTKEEFKKQAKKLEKELETLPQHIKEAKIPVIILFLCIEKHLVAGLTSGGVKG